MDCANEIKILLRRIIKIRQLKEHLFASRYDNKTGLVIIGHRKEYVKTNTLDSIFHSHIKIVSIHAILGQVNILLHTSKYFFCIHLFHSTIFFKRNILSMASEKRKKKLTINNDKQQQKLLRARII